MRGQEPWDPLEKAIQAAFLEYLLEQVWRNPASRRMAITFLCRLEGWSEVKVGKILGFSAADLEELELGLRPMSREDLEKIVAAQKLPRRRFEEIFLLTHAMVIMMDTGWEMTWQDQLEPLSFPERRALIAADKELQNGGLAELLCEKSREADDPEEAVALAELAFLVLELVKAPVESFRLGDEGFVWGHLGHALQRRGDQAAAEAAFAECIKRWETGDGFESVDRQDRSKAEILQSLVPGLPPYDRNRRLSRSRPPRQEARKGKRR
ncbi:MAG TPA: hypothetical protein DD490_16335 [Acidobacteria bacterium]|nr:hypothetical protein [Acidobacteriota bacterium]